MISQSILWTSLEATVITGGRSTQDWSATGICLKAEDVRPGDLFFAGQNEDLDKVFLKGAVAAVVPWNTPDHAGWTLLKVPDVFTALWDLARAARYKTHAEVIAVQGRATRVAIIEVLSGSFAVHAGGRHLSQGLASLPEVADFAIYGCAPQTRPNFAVITDCDQVDGAVFEAMQPSGRVLITSDEGDIASVIAKARAAGIRNIFTFGHAIDADARLMSVVTAQNGVRAQIRVLGDIIEVVLPAGSLVTPAMLAAALILELSEQDPARIAQCLAGAPSLSRPSDIKQTSDNIILWNQSSAPSQAAFRVINMIDTGRGRSTAVLDNVFAHYGSGLSLADKNIKMPQKIGDLDLMYACKNTPLLHDAEQTLQARHGAAHVGAIVPDVVRPGDFVTFKGLVNTSCSMIANVLRNVNAAPKKEMKADHAV